MKTKILILFSLTALFSSCQKNDNSVGGNSHYDISEDLYPLLFTPGSYWIYENQSRRMDSVNLISSEVDTVGPFNSGKGFTSTSEAYNIVYESSVYGTYQEQFVGYVISKGSVDGDYIYLSSFDVGDASRNARIAAIHDSLEIRGIAYNNVVEMEISKDNYINSEMRLCWVDSIGLVQKIIFENPNDSVIWQLIEYKVELNF